jgi:hypothetical protein
MSELWRLTRAGAAEAAVARTAVLMIEAFIVNWRRCLEDLKVM